MSDNFECVRYDLCRLGPLLAALKQLHGLTDTDYTIDHNPGCDSSRYSVGITFHSPEHHEAYKAEQYAFQLLSIPMSEGDPTDIEQIYERQRKAHVFAAAKKWGEGWENDPKYAYWSLEFGHLERDVDPVWSPEWDR